MGSYWVLKKFGSNYYGLVILYSFWINSILNINLLIIQLWFLSIFLDFFKDRDIGLFPFIHHHHSPWEESSWDIEDILDFEITSTIDGGYQWYMVMT